MGYHPLPLWVMVASVEPEPARAELEADFPPWRIGRRGDLVNAWRPGTTPPLVIRDVTLTGLRKRLEVFEGVLANEGHVSAEVLDVARQRAERLVT